MSELFDTRPLDVLCYAKVALEQGIDKAPEGLTYAVPGELGGIEVGDRVIVPLGRADKPTPGYVTAVEEETDLPTGKVKAIISRDETGVSLTADLMALARWLSSYYCCPLGMVFQTMLPAAVKHGTGKVARRVVRWRGDAADVERAEKGDGSEDASREAGNEAAGDAQTTGGDGDEKDATKQPKKPKLTKLQKAVLEVARSKADEEDPWLERKELAFAAGAKTVTPVNNLVDMGLLEETIATHVQARRMHPLAELQPIDNRLPDEKLSEAQRIAIDHLGKETSEGFGVHVLHGVTGSGKTEVYLRVIERVRQRYEQSARGAGVIVLVPEIALTPQTAGRFVGRFGEEHVAVLHSGLTATQRHHHWRRIRKGDASVVVGARSAIFAPLDNLRLVIVDEEHESSYKQDQLPRYHARDVAIKRAQVLGVPVVLGSATPSLETYFNAVGLAARGNGGRDAHRAETSGRDAHAHETNGREAHAAGESLRDIPPKKHYHLLRLPDRVTGLKLPKVSIVDMSQERRKRYEYTGKAGIHLLSLRLEHALRKTFAEGSQAMLLLNRRGYANYISCPDHRCGWLKMCEFCDALMVYHRMKTLPTGGLVRCHHCNAEQMLPVNCPNCGKKITTFGLGTQRVEEEIERKFADVPMLRMDSDTMHTARDYVDSLEAFRRGEVKLLVGTQMIAKGLDFPNVAVVGVVSADTAINLPDFRAAERTFQLIAQVAGRAGRGDRPGEVIVQTFNPDDAAIELASRHDYEAFAQRELSTRAEVGLPPISRMARIVVRDRDLVKATTHAKTVAAAMQQHIKGHGLDVRLRGPMPCAIARVAEYHRQQIELVAETAGVLQQLLTAMRNAGLVKSDHTTAVDVDPVSLL